MYVFIHIYIHIYIHVYILIYIYFIATLYILWLALEQVHILIPLLLLILIILITTDDSQGSAKHGTALDEEDIDERLCPLSQRICVVVDFECSSISTSTNIDITKAEKEMKSGDKSVDAPAPNPDPVKFLLMKSNGELEWKDLSTRIYRNLPIRKEASDFTVLRQITFDVEEWLEISN